MCAHAAPRARTHPWNACARTRPCGMWSARTSCGRETQTVLCPCERETNRATVKGARRRRFGGCFEVPEMTGRVDCIVRMVAPYDTGAINASARTEERALDPSLLTACLSPSKRLRNGVIPFGVRFGRVRLGGEHTRHRITLTGGFRNFIVYKLCGVMCHGTPRLTRRGVTVESKIRCVQCRMCGGDCHCV